MVDSSQLIKKSRTKRGLLSADTGQNERTIFNGPVDVRTTYWANRTRMHACIIIIIIIVVVVVVVNIMQAW
jgi:t-SNARE complex subunit (syntaxin)